MTAPNTEERRPADADAAGTDRGMTTAAVRRGSRAMGVPAVNPIRALRLGAHWSVGRLAAAAGLSAATVRRVEAGGRPSQPTLQRLGRALGLDLATEFARRLDPSSPPALADPPPSGPRSCEWCDGPIGRTYADGRARRYCCRSCIAAATCAWHRWVNRQWRRGALLAPSCRLPEPERLAELARVEADLAELAARLRIAEVIESPTVSRAPLPPSTAGTGGEGGNLYSLSGASTSACLHAHGRASEPFLPMTEEED